MNSEREREQVYLAQFGFFSNLVVQIFSTPNQYMKQGVDEKYVPSFEIQNSNHHNCAP